MLALDGIFPPVTTPFARGDVDLAALQSNIDQYMRTPLRGIVVLGSNGEAPFVDEEEADRMISAARDRVPRDRVLIAGAGRESTRATVRACRRAGSLGADAVLVRTPSYFKTQMTAEAFARHYIAVADESPVPVLLYNFTAVTGVTLPPAVIGQLGSHPNIIGMKESGSDVALLADYIAQAPAGFQVLGGSAFVFYAGLCLGAVGAILAAACVLPEFCVRLFEMVREQRHADALDLQRRLVPLARLVTAVYGVPGLKAAMNVAGYVGGECRSPLGAASPRAVEEIREQLAGLRQDSG